MKLTTKKNMSEEMVFAQELSDDELETVNGGAETGCRCAMYQCTGNNFRYIYFLNRFPDCAATVEDGSWCWSNDACTLVQVTYTGMNDCSRAWR